LCLIKQWATEWLICCVAQISNIKKKISWKRYKLCAKIEKDKNFCELVQQW
jgi:hypothetical protein